MKRDEKAIWTPSPNCWPDRSGYTPRYVIIHSTAGGGSVSWLTNPASQVSAHYVILRDGTIYQLVDEEAAAWANGVLSAGHDAWWSAAINPNLLTISIEHEKLDLYNQEALTTAQVAASMQLVSRICARWNIPLRRADGAGGITGHYSVDPVNRSHCPGVYPWDTLYAYLAQSNKDDLKVLQLTDAMGSFFTASSDGTRWMLKNSNVSIAYAHLDFFRRYEGILGLPLTNELYLTELPDSAIQIYERGIAIYDPKRKYGPPPAAGQVYLMMISQGVGQKIIAKPLTVELQTQVANLQAQIASASAAPAAELAQVKQQLAAYQAALQQIANVTQATK